MSNRYRREATVTTGLRSPDQSPARLGMATTDGREPEVLGENAQPEHLTPPDPKRTVRRFRSQFRNHMVLLEAFQDDRMPNGQIIKGKTFKAQFKDGYYETSNPDHIARLLANPNCSMDGDYWDADEQDHASAVAREHAFKDGLRNDPVQRAAFRKAMAAGDFDDILNGRDERETVES